MKSVALIVSISICMQNPRPGMEDLHANGFPDALTACTQLRRLSLEFSSGSILINKLPEAISALVQLETLRLVDCGVSHLPHSLSQLSALSQLVLTRVGHTTSWQEGERECVYGIYMPRGLLKAPPALTDVQIMMPSPTTWSRCIT